jgi:radical SAM protein (TIGR01212 family)
MTKPYRDLNSYFREKFGHRVHKLTVDAGLTCPNRDGTLSTRGCIYCNATGSGTGAYARGLSVRDQLERSKIPVAKRFKARKFIAYFQSFTNTYAPLETLARLYEEALGVKDVIGLSIGTRPDCVNDAVLDLLAEHARRHLVWVEYGLQSACDSTLRRINRGHDVACFTGALARTRERGLPVCAHMILGLPGETRRDMLATAEFLADHAIDGVKLHLLYVIRDTPLDVLFRQGGFTCLEQQAYAELVCDVIERLPPHTVIQRVTGDPHPRELVAPAWALRKRDTLDLIHAIFRERNSRQGHHYTPGPNAPPSGAPVRHPADRTPDGIR